MDIGWAARFWWFPCCPSEKRGRYFLKKTQNYQLNQWDATDRILREDFNEDNARIDAALEGTKPFTKLKEFTISQTGTQVEANISDIDFSQYHYVILDILGSMSGSLKFYCNTPAGSSYMYFSGNSTFYNSLGNIVSNAAGKISGRIIFFPYHNGEERLTCVTHSQSSLTFGINGIIAMKDLSSVVFINSI
jgi:hypothetical protein